MSSPTDLPIAPAARAQDVPFARQQSLEDAKAVLDLVRFENCERLRQFLNGDGCAAAVESKSYSTNPCATMQVDTRWRETELAADAVRGVVDRELADHVDRFTDLPNDFMEFIEGCCFPYNPLTAGEARPELPEGIGGDSILVRVLPATRSTRMGCPLDYLAEGRRITIEL